MSRSRSKLPPRFWAGAAEKIGEPANSLYAKPESREPLFQRVQKNGVAYDYETELRRKDGTTLWCEVSDHVLFDEQGNPVGFAGVTRAASERHRSEMLLREFPDVFLSAASR